MSTETGDAQPQNQSPIGPDGRYYQMLLKNHFISDLTAHKSYENFLHMEHSYSRDWRPLEGAHIMTTRTIMVHRPPQCPSCHIHTHDEGVDMNESYNPPIPTYNQDDARHAMLESERVADAAAAAHPQHHHHQNHHHADHPDSDSDHDWEDRLQRASWTREQAALFAAVSRILDLDRLARLANAGRLHEPVLRRVVIDKSVARLRKAIARVQWQPALTQWLHALLVDNLPATYMAAYLDIMQSLRAKLPTLVEPMMRLRPAGAGSAHADLLAPVMRAAWEPCVAHKDRKLPGTAPVVVVVPPAASQSGPPPARMQRWYDLLGTMATVVAVQVQGGSGSGQSVHALTEHMVALTRARLQEIRNEVPGRPIVLVGFNAGAALAVQVAMVETVSSVVCMGFAYNTVGGVRGTADDRILELTTPVMFVLGQNAARSSQEEIESLRERMQAQTSLVVVGSADDALRVGKTKRQIEGVTQAMVDNMIIDEVSEFAATCIINPPAPRDLNAELAANAKLTNGPSSSAAATQRGAGGCAAAAAASGTQKKRKGSICVDGTEPTVKAAKTARGVVNVGRPRNITPPTTNAAPVAIVAKTTAKSLAQQPTADALSMAIQSILPPSSSSAHSGVLKDPLTGGEILSTFEVQPNMVLKPIPIQTPTGTTLMQRKTTTGGSPIVITQHSTGLGTMPQLGTRIALTSANVQAASSQHHGTPIAFNAGTMHKIVLPSNQFVKIKPPGLNTQKLYTLNTANSTTSSTSPKPAPMYTIRTQTAPIGGAHTAGKVYTVKSTPTGTQLLSAASSNSTNNAVGVAKPPHMISVSAPGGGSMMISPKTYTFVKQQPSGGVAGSSGQQQHIIKLTKPGDLSAANIFDMPIVFADNEGNIQDNAAAAAAAAAAAGSTGASATTVTVSPAPMIISSSISSPATASATHHNSLGSVVLNTSGGSSIGGGSTTTLHNRNIIINTIAPRPAMATATIGGGSGTTNKVVLINRPMKGAQSIQIGGSMSSMTMLPANAIVGGGMQKFTKVNVSNASSISLPVRTNIEMVRGAAGQLTTVGGHHQFKTSAGTTFTLGANKVEMISNAIIRAAPHTSSAATAASSSSIASPMRTAIGTFNVAAKQQMTTGSGVAGNTAATSGGAQQYNPIVINVDSDKTTIKNIIKVGDTQIKPTNTIVLKPGTLRPMMKPGILNRNVTVRKVNLVQPQQQLQQRPTITMSPQGSQIVLQQIGTTTLSPVASAAAAATSVTATTSAVQTPPKPEA